MARFLLDLRAKSIHPNGTHSAQVSQSSTVQIAIAEEFQDPLYHTSYMRTRVYGAGQAVDSEDMDAYAETTTVNAFEMFP